MRRLKLFWYRLQYKVFYGPYCSKHDEPKAWHVVDEGRVSYCVSCDKEERETNQLISKLDQLGKEGLLKLIKYLKVNAKTSTK